MPPVLLPDARLRAAMLEAVSRHGYPKTTISELAGLANVSKSTFYQHFAGKEACFLATLNEIVDVQSRRTGSAYRQHSGQGLREGLAASAAEFSRLVVERPEAARFVLIDSLTLGATAVPHLSRASLHFEAMFRRSFDDEPALGSISDLEIRAIVGGMRRLVYRKLRAGAPEEIEAGVESLFDWALGYLNPTSDDPGPEQRSGSASRETGSIEPSSGALQPEETLPWDAPPDSPAARKQLTQRERILRAVAIVSTERGYSALSIPSITATAGVSNQTFYEHFPSKLDAFFSAFTAMERRALLIALNAFESQSTWVGGIEASVAALANNIAANPIHARLAFFELQAAGPAALDRADAAMDSYTLFLRPERVRGETPIQPPPEVVDAIGGGIWWIIQNEISRGRGASVPEIVPDLVNIVLTPFGVRRTRSHTGSRRT